MNIGIIEVNKLFREKLVNEINPVQDYNVILNCDSIDAFQYWHQFHFKLDVIFLGLDNVQMSCADGIHLVKSKRPDIQIVILTGKNDEQCIVNALKAGANGYLLKDPFPAIRKELQMIKAGHNPVSPTVVNKLFAYFNPPRTIFTKCKRDELTQKEALVIKYIIDGLPYNKIAEQMRISINGVSYHTKNIFKKLQVNSKAEVFKKYIDGLIRL